MRRRWIAVGVVVLLVAGLGVVWWVQAREDRSRFARAVAMAPESSARLTWTDWAGVRDELGAELSASSSVGDLEDFLLEAFDRDLGSTSALESSAPTIHEELGFSPATLDWELFAQGEQGALLVLGLPEGFDYDGLRGRLQEIGFSEPDDPDGVWRGGVDVLEGLSGHVTPELAAIRIDEEDGVLLGSDREPYLADSDDAERGDREDGISAVVDATGDALSAVAYSGDHACSALAMTGADPTDRTRAAELVEAAGEVHPLDAYAIGERPGDEVRVAMAFEDEDQARIDADSRSRLAAGPAPGQGGTFAERFDLGRVAADGKVLTMELTPVDGAFVLSEFSQGPVLFATC